MLAVNQPILKVTLPIKHGRITWAIRPVLALFLLLSLARGFSQNTAVVYLTAKDTNQRLAKTGELTFADMPQPPEKQETILVDPSKTFQTMLGIGGALTDASAETFYRLPRDKQREILTDRKSVV